MERAICAVIEGAEDSLSCKKSNHYNQCCQECNDNDCSGCDYRHDRGCIVKKWIEE